MVRTADAPAAVPSAAARRGPGAAAVHAAASDAALAALNACHGLADTVVPPPGMSVGAPRTFIAPTASWTDALNFCNFSFEILQF